MDELIRQMRDFKREWEEMKKTFYDLKRELGVREGRVLSEQIDELEKKSLHQQELINQISRDVTAMRKLLEYNDVNVREVMKALSLIYRNVDDLEENLIPEEQQSLT